MTLAFDHDDNNLLTSSDVTRIEAPRNTLGFSLFKRGLDFTLAVPLVLLTGVFAAILLVVNPFLIQENYSLFRNAWVKIACPLTFTSFVR